MDNNQQQFNQQPQYQQPQYQQPQQVYIPEEYKPISMWGYFGYAILFNLPVVGLIVAIVLSFVAKNVNLKNYARSQFCYLIIVAICFAIFGASIAALISFM